MTPCDLILHALDIVDLILMLLQGDLEQLGLQHFIGVIAVLELASLGLARNHNAGGLVDQTNSRRCFVDVLAACTAGTEHLHFHILGANVHLNVVVQLGHYLQAGKAGLAAGLRVKRAHTHQTVYAVFAFEHTISVGALDHHGSALHAGFVTVQIVQQLHGVAVGIGPAVVHTIQHLCPVLCFSAARTGVEGENGVAVVIFTVQHGHQLQIVHSFFHLFHGLLALGDQVRVVFFLQHFQHGLCILVQSRQLFIAFQLAAQGAQLIIHLLAGLLVIIKAGHGHFIFQFSHALFAAFNGKRFAQILHGGLKAIQLEFQFVNRDHIRVLPFLL